MRKTTLVALDTKDGLWEVQSVDLWDGGPNLAGKKLGRWEAAALTWDLLISFFLRVWENNHCNVYHVERVSARDRPRRGLWRRAIGGRDNLLLLQKTLGNSIPVGEGVCCQHQKEIFKCRKTKTVSVSKGSDFYPTDFSFLILLLNIAFFWK